MKLLLSTLLYTFLLLYQAPLQAQYKANPNGNGGMLHGYTLQGQEEHNWCWAASGSMVMTYVSASHAPEQCTEVQDRFHGNCCVDSASSTCNKPGWPNFEAYGFKAEQTKKTALSFEQIKSNLEANSPVCFTWLWTTGGGHMLTVDGWAIINGVEHIHVQDSWPVGTGRSYWITYQAYVSGPNYHHGNDICQITHRSLFDRLLNE